MIEAIAIIPSRYGSTRFPGKPLAAIAGKPMIRHVCDRARSCRCLKDVYVATDDEIIYRTVTDFGGKAVMTAGHHRSGTDRICEAAEILGLGPDVVVVNIQGDQPAFPPPDASGNALYFSRAVIPFPRDGAAPEFHKHLGFYAYGVRFLKTFTELPEGRLEAVEKLEQLRALEYGYRIRVVETGFDSLEVDVPGDIARIESHLATV